MLIDDADVALAYACESGHMEIVQLLVNAGSSIEQADKDGRTPLMKAARAGHIETVRYLLSKGLSSRSIHPFQRRAANHRSFRR